ncbi:MAG: ABC transporter permease [Anaerolineae bacterium]
MRLRILRIVTGSEYRRRMGRVGFLVGAFALPLVVLVGIVLAGYLAVSSSESAKPFGVVDEAALLTNPRQLPEAEAPQFVPYPDEQAARAAVMAGEVGAAFVIAPDYATSRQVTSLSEGTLGGGLRSTFLRWLRWNLAAGLPDDIAARATDGVDLVTRSLDGRREFSERTWPNVVIPFVAAILFFIIVIGNASDALRAVVDEKESRTMEILVTSVSPNELMAGKILAIFLVGVTQLLVWSVVLGVAIVVAKQRIPELSAFQLDWSFVAIVALAFLPAYVLIAGLLAAAGAISSELREGQQLSTFVTLPTFVPAWFTALFIANPNSPLAVALTLFPLTAPLSLSIRWSFATIPTWQLVLSIGILMASAVGSIYAAARLFRAGMLRYGQRLTWSEVRRALRFGRSE